MAKQIFEIAKDWRGPFNEYISWKGEIELDDAVIGAVTDEWRSKFYDLRTPQAVAENIVYNMIVNRRTLSQLDGFANLPDEYAQIISELKRMGK